jgi:hypothetical protein
MRAISTGLCTARSSAVLVRDNAPELRLVHERLDSRAGIGRIAVGMARQGYDLQLTRYDERGWRATFYTTGGDGAFAHERDRHRMGADAVARDAAGGVGGRRAAMARRRGLLPRSSVAPISSSSLAKTVSQASHVSPFVASRVAASETTPDSPGSGCPGASNHEAGVQASGG